MRAVEIITEALKPSQYRKYVKGWDKTKYDALFNGKYRIYLPLIADTTSSKKTQQPNPEVVAALTKNGYQVSDYTKGLAFKKDDPRKQQIKIGKILSDTRLAIPAAIKQLFDNDPDRQSVKSYTDNLMVVISRHPYDIAGMSTGRGWTSCMNLHDGSNRRYVAADVKEGTLIAYLVDKGDLDIKRPKGRVLIKPFINIANNDEVALGVENVVYPEEAPDVFAKTVVSWANKVNASLQLTGKFNINPNMYRDRINQTMHLVYGNEEEIINRLQSGEISLDHVPEDNRTEKVCLAAVTKDGRVLRYVPESLRTEKIYLAAITNNGSALGRAPLPLRTEKLCLIAVTNDGRALEYVPKTLCTEKICLAAVRDNGSALEYVPEPVFTEKICLAAVTNTGDKILNHIALDYVPLPLRTEKICLAAVTTHGLALSFVPKPLRTEKICLAAVTNEFPAIRHVPAHLQDKINDYMRQNRLPSTVALENALVQKWKNIK